MKRVHDKKKTSKSTSKSGLASSVVKSRATSTSRSTNTFSLQRRISTATPVKYDMYLLNIETMFHLFGTVARFPR